jgi:virulence-associated protein VagC
VNDLAKVTADGRTVVVDLAEALDPSQLDLRVIREGRRIVLEPVAAGDDERRIPPGSYTMETLPP